MMQLSRIALVNWHLFGKIDLEVDGDGAILGRNRSGKSTLIDLIQVVMTGGSASYFRLNRSAGESGARSARTLKSYCLGQLSDDKSLRQHGVTHIALTFQDEARLRRPVTIGLCIEVPPGETDTIAGRYVADGYAARSDDFVQAGPGGATSAPWSVARGRLATACEQDGGSLIISATANAHIKEMMRTLFTGRRIPAVDRFARAFVLATSFEDISAVAEFVKNYLLEKNDVEIGELRESVQRYRQIQREIHELERRLDALKALQAQLIRFDHLVERESTARGMAKLAELIESASTHFKALKEFRGATAALASTERELSRYADLVTAIEAELEALNAQMATSDTAARRHMVETNMKLIQGQRQAPMQRLQARFVAASRACGLLDQRDRLQTLKIGDILLALERVRSESAGLTPPQWPRDPVTVEALLGQVVQLARARRSSIDDRRIEAIAQQARSDENLRELDRRLRSAQEGRASLDRRTEALMAALRAAGMKPRTVCEVTDVIDESWRNAAEALLGRAREAILVDPSDAPQAIRMLREGGTAYQGCRVANTRRLATASTTPSTGTLAAMLRGSDDLAMAYVVFRLGSVRLAHDQEDLVAEGRAVLKDGSHYDGIDVEMRRPEGGLKIGRSAAGLMIETLKAEIADERAIRAKHHAWVTLLEDVLKRLDDLDRSMEPQNTLPSLTDAITGLDDQLSELEARLAEIHAFADPGLQAAFEEAKARLRAARRDKDELSGDVGALRQKIQERRRQLDGAQSQPGAQLHLALKWKLFRQQVPGLASYALVKAAYKTRREGKSPLAIAIQMLGDADDALAESRVCGSLIREMLSSYRHTFDTAAPAPSASDLLLQVRPFVDEHVERLESNELIGYRRQADMVAEQVIGLFRTNLVHELNTRLADLDEELNLINGALKARPLHGEIYRLKAQVRPEFQDLHDLARESAADDADLATMLAKGEAGEGRHATALAFIARLLQDEDIDFVEYQDYRNYYHYDLRSQDQASGREMSFERRRGTASGAERQVPFYVIIGAALAAIYHGARHVLPRGDLGLGLAVFDEAFTKLDGPNQRTLLDFYRSIGLQVVIAAPSEKRAAVVENLDWIADVFRVKDSASIEYGHYKSQAREAMRAANPEHLDDDELEVRLAIDAAE